MPFGSSRQYQKVRCALALSNFLRRADFPPQRLPRGSGQAKRLRGIVTDQDGPRQHALGSIAAGGERVEDASKNLRLDDAQISETVPILGIDAQTLCTFENVHGSYTRRAPPGSEAKRIPLLGKRARTETIRVCSVDTRAFASHDSCSLRNPNLKAPRNQSGRLSVPSMRLLPSERAANHDRAVTANASIRSVGDLSRHRIYIEDVYPLVDGGRFPVKRTVGEEVDVWADIFRDGHAVLAADLVWRREEAEKWFRVPMVLQDNDRWRASFTPQKTGHYVYAIEAWTDVFATWRRNFLTKRDAGLDVSLEVEEGRNLLTDLRLKSAEGGRLIREASAAGLAENPASLLSEELAAAARSGQQSDLTRSANFPLLADRPIARAGAWYEMMPRSQSSVPGRHGTFDDCINRLPDIAALGFDVLYLTPIHPIGRTNRKGRNNSLGCNPVTRAVRMPSALSRAVTTPCIPSLGRSKISGAWCKPARISEWRSLSTLPSSAHQITPGLRSIRNGSDAGRTVRFNTQRTRQRSTRTS